MHSRKFPRIALLLLLFGNTVVFAAPYVTDEVSCDGFPRVRVVTQDELCLGLVAQAGEHVPFVKPRTIAALSNERFLIADMGGWSAGRGKLILLQLDKQHRAHLTTLLDNLDRPHGLAVGPQGMIYFGEPSRIRRFSLRNDHVVGLETIIDKLPDSEGDLHPLSMFVFDREWNLVVNTGASTDQCLKKGAARPTDCDFRNKAGLRLYRYMPQVNRWSDTFSMLATGLRNSMALAVHSSGTLLQAENSMDFADAREPYEEINVVEKGGFYGWPYCYDQHAVNPAWADSADQCAGESYRPPWTLMPPHTAPLGMLYYKGDRIPSLKGKLIVSWHGYRVVGNRIVAYAVDRLGRPILQEAAYYWSDPVAGESGPQQHRFSADGGMDGVAQHEEVVSGWNSVPGVRPEGAPVGMAEASDGSLFIVDDKNRAVLRLSHGPSYRDRAQSEHATNSSAVSVPASVMKLFKLRCMPCHVELRQRPALLLNRNKWLASDAGKFLIEQRVFAPSPRAMPPGNPLSQAEREVLKQWFDAMRIKP